MTRIALDPDALRRAAASCEASADALRRAAGEAAAARGALPAGGTAVASLLLDGASLLRSGAEGLAGDAATMRRAAGIVEAIDVGPFGVVAVAGAGAVLPLVDAANGAAGRSISLAFDVQDAVIDAAELAVVAGQRAWVLGASAGIAGVPSGSPIVRLASAGARAGAAGARVAAALDSPLVEVGGRAVVGIGVVTSTADAVNAFAEGRDVDGAGALLSAGGSAAILLGATGPVGWVALGAIGAGLAIQHRREIAGGAAAGGRAAWRGVRWAGRTGRDVARSPVGRAVAAAGIPALAPIVVPLVATSVHPVALAHRVDDALGRIASIL